MLLAATRRRISQYQAQICHYPALSSPPYLLIPPFSPISDTPNPPVTHLLSSFTLLSLTASARAPVTARLWHISSSNKQQRCSQSGRRERFVKKKKKGKKMRKETFFYHHVSLVRTKWGSIDRQGWTGNMCSKQRSFCILQQPCSVRHRSFQDLQGSISWVSPCRSSSSTQTNDTLKMES